MSATGATADAVATLIGRLTDDDLNDLARVPWLGFEARHAITGNSCGHYEDHFEALDQLGSGAA
jgi:hypothetical protein